MSDSKPPMSALSRFGLFVLAGAVALVGVLWGVLHYLPAPKKASAGPAANAAPAPKPSPSPAPGPAAERPPSALDPAEVAKVVQTIEQALAVLKDPNNPGKAEALAALREALRQADPKVAIAAIRQFLSTGRDAVTGERFKVGEGGALEGSPTVRTLLMDQLGSLSSDIHTADAVEAARETLATKGSPDEWAVAMRNVAWNDPVGSKALLAGKARELLTYAPWQQQPSGGYLEAFDAAAYSGDATLVEVLDPLAREKSPLQAAALVALDRLAGMAPGQMADYLNSHPDVLADRPLIRADYMGKVDLSDTAQRSQAESYLQRDNVTQPEKEKFLARLGMPAGFVSDNLLTPPHTSTMPLMERRALVNQVANQWLTSGNYPALQGALQTLISDTQP